MLPPYVVEEYDGKFWVHKRRRYVPATGTYIKGERVCDKGFDNYDEAQRKASILVVKTGTLW